MNKNRKSSTDEVKKVDSCLFVMNSKAYRDTYEIYLKMTNHFLLNVINLKVNFADQSIRTIID